MNNRYDFDPSSKCLDALLQEPTGERSSVFFNIKGQFHIRDLFLGKFNSGDDFAERILKKSISRA